MTTIGEIRNVWQNVFDDATIQAYTTNIYNYDLDLETQKDFSLVYLNQEINFIHWEVKEGRDGYTIGGQIKKRYEVTVFYTLEKDKTGSNALKIYDFIETLNKAVENVIKLNWLNSVDYMVINNEAAEKEIVEINNKECFRISNKYIGIKRE